MGLAFLGLAISGCPEQPDPAADPEVFCMEREERICLRDWAAGRITDEERDACEASIGDACVGESWPTGCAPSEDLTTRCIDALSDSARIDEPFESVVECQEATLCGG